MLATRRSLEVPDRVVLPVSYSGGAFAGSPLLVAAFGDALAALQPRVECRVPLFPPVIGAALYAARRAGTPLTDGALATLSRQCATAALAR